MKKMAMKILEKRINKELMNCGLDITVNDVMDKLVTKTSKEDIQKAINSFRNVFHTNPSLESMFNFTDEEWAKAFNNNVD